MCQYPGLFGNLVQPRLKRRPAPTKPTHDHHGPRPDARTLLTRHHQRRPRMIVDGQHPSTSPNVRRKASDAKPRNNARRTRTNDGRRCAMDNNEQGPRRTKTDDDDKATPTPTTAKGDDEATPTPTLTNGNAGAAHQCQYVPPSSLLASPSLLSFF